ncbi:MAG: hypothetical protein RQ751_05985 [Longimicrobiales bacterium]|nr:hypothetical protein [Longimicrobiales bacterium]
MHDHAQSAPLFSMLAEMAGNPSLKESFARDPDAFMDRHGVSADHKARLKSALTAMETGNVDEMRRFVSDAAVHPDTCLLTFP